MKPIKVLVADDHESFRRTLAEYLRAQEGVEVVGEAFDGEDVVQQVERLHPDLILMDINMPRQNGFDASRAIKRRCPEMKVYIVSANEGDVYRTMAARNSVDGYVSKWTLKRDILALIGGLLSDRMATSYAA